jgi:glycosyltransferase involved in cell wall biosynthesis
MTELNISARVGAVVIGRNEGERLSRCLTSLAKQLNKIVYVDSGSTDNSLENAAMMDIEVINLNLNQPFTAARARNEGFRHLIQVFPEVEYVQFVDGDCEVVLTWFNESIVFIDSNQDYAAVCGRRRERYPEQSIYNLMCDIEWNTPIGDAKACGGDAMFRVKAFNQVEGYRNDLIAGEEPELCVRLRASGWKIMRLDSEMTMHDAAITKFSQWWKRNVRSGYAFAEGAYLHGAAPNKHWVKESRRAMIWGLLIPILAILLGTLSWLLAVITMLVYPLQITRLAVRNLKLTIKHPLKIAFFNVLSKFAEMYGQINYYYLRFFRKTPKLIEYK